MCFVLCCVVLCVTYAWGLRARQQVRTVLALSPRPATRSHLSATAAAESARRWAAAMWPGPPPLGHTPYTLSNRALIDGDSLPYLLHPRLPWALVL
jgi:hypothetical protein